jgi:hypothetical protein
MSDEDEPRGYVHFSAAYHELPIEVPIADDLRVFMWPDKETRDRQKAQGVEPMLKWGILATVKLDFEAPTTRIRWKLIAPLGLLPIPGSSPPVYGVEMQFTPRGKTFAVRAPADVTREENTDCVIGRDVLDHVHRYGDTLLVPQSPPPPPPTREGTEALDRTAMALDAGPPSSLVAGPPPQRPALTGDRLLSDNDLRDALVARMNALEPYVRATHAEALELGAVAPVMVIAEPSDPIGAAIRTKAGCEGAVPCVVGVSAADLLRQTPLLWPAHSRMPFDLQLVEHGELVVLILSHMSALLVFVDHPEKNERPAPAQARPSALN